MWKLSELRFDCSLCSALSNWDSLNCNVMENSLDFAIFAVKMCHFCNTIIPVVRSNYSENMRIHYIYLERISFRFHKYVHIKKKAINNPFMQSFCSSV